MLLHSVLSFQNNVQVWEVRTARECFDLCQVCIRIAGWYIYLKQSDMKWRFHSLGTSPSSGNGHVLPSRYSALGHGYTMTHIQFISHVHLCTRGMYIGLSTKPIRSIYSAWSHSLVPARESVFTICTCISLVQAPPPFWESPGLVVVCAPKSDRNRNITTWPTIPSGHLQLTRW